MHIVLYPLYEVSHGRKGQYKALHRQPVMETSKKLLLYKRRVKIQENKSIKMAYKTYKLVFSKVIITI